MNQMPSERFLAAFLVVAALVVGILTDAFAWAGLAAALVWIALQQREFSELRRFSRTPLSGPQFRLPGWIAAPTGACG